MIILHILISFPTFIQAAIQFEPVAGYTIFQTAKTKLGKHFRNSTHAVNKKINFNHSHMSKSSQDPALPVCNCQF